MLSQYLKGTPLCRTATPASNSPTNTCTAWGRTCSPPSWPMRGEVPRQLVPSIFTRRYLIFFSIHVLLTCMGLFVTSPRFSASCFVRMGGCGLRPIQRHARLPVSSRAGPRPVQHQLAHEGGLSCFCILGCRHRRLYTTCCTHRQRRMGSGSSGSTSQPPDFSKRGLRIARLIQTDDHARWEALRKIKTSVLINPSASDLGTTLISNAALLKSDQQLGSSIVGSDSSKATGTLVKRAGSLRRFAKFCSTHGILDPLSPHEAIIYEYHAALSKASVLWWAMPGMWTLRWQRRCLRKRFLLS